MKIDQNFKNSVLWVSPKGCKQVKLALYKQKGDLSPILSFLPFLHLFWSHAGVFLCKTKHFLCSGKGVIEALAFVKRFDKLWQQKLSFLYFGMNSHPFIGPLMLFQSVTLYPQAII